MCGRFFVEGESENELLARMIDEASRRQQSVAGESAIATGEVFPAATVAAMAFGKSGRLGVFPMQWGFHRPDGKGLIINTRSETALEKPLFRQAMLERRCLIPCSWYYEWETQDAQTRLFDAVPSLQVQPDSEPTESNAKHPVKIRYAIRPKTVGIMYLAGIYRYEECARFPSLSILTREPAREIAFIHDRMPVIFSESTRTAWLDRSVDPRTALTRCEMEMQYRIA